MDVITNAIRTFIIASGIVSTTVTKNRSGENVSVIADKIPGSTSVATADSETIKSAKMVEIRMNSGQSGIDTINRIIASMVKIGPKSAVSNTSIEIARPIMQRGISIGLARR